MILTRWARRPAAGRAPAAAAAAPPGRRALLLVALLLAASAAPAALAINETQQYAMGMGPLYHSSQDIYAQLGQLSRRFVRPVLLRDPVNGTQAQHMFRVANGAGSQAAARLPTALIICNQHAREMITAEVCFWLVRLLARDTKTLMEWPEFRAALKTGAGRARLGAVPTRRALNSWVGEVLSKVKVEVVPVVNQEGRDYIQRTGDFSQRKTVTTEVDLNRNWVTFRAQPDSGASELHDWTDVYQGPSALSEWQTRSIYHHMKNGVASKALFVDVHSGIWNAMSPWGGKFDTSDVPLATVDRWQAMLDAVQAPFAEASWPGYNLSTTGIASGPGAGLLYRSRGSADDTAFADAGFPNVMTVEVYTPVTSASSGVGWRCPRLREWRAACTEDNRCGNTVCVDRDGTLQPPSSYMDSSARAQAVGAAAAATLAVSASAAAAVGLDTASDPFLSRQGSDSYLRWFLVAFCPTTAEDYRLVVGKWAAALLFAIDDAARRL